MKIYRILDMYTYKRTKTEENYKIGSYGTIGGIIYDKKICKNEIEKEKNKLLKNEKFGKIEILKDEELEFQGKLIEQEKESIFIIKAVEITILE